LVFKVAFEINSNGLAELTPSGSSVILNSPELAIAISQVPDYLVRYT
jgi:hypothetical protein